jgi:hypothetical protein
MESHNTAAVEIETEYGIVSIQAGVIPAGTPSAELHAWARAQAKAVIEDRDWGQDVHAAPWPSGKCSWVHRAVRGLNRVSIRRAEEEKQGVIHAGNTP